MVQYWVTTYHVVHNATIKGKVAKFPTLDLAIDYVSNLYRDDDFFGWDTTDLNYFTYRIERVNGLNETV